MDADFDVHDHRHQLKQLQDSGETAVFENRDGLTCPACSREFERLMLVEPRQYSVPSNAGSPFCLLRRDDDLVLFRH
ncbi:flagella cluster protein [Salinadaptatus halalkaliphilus]|uniref:Flagella cluster protein n=1 Tax=Salinadaptatus halalkaliphilus TaxID=2419781 RepID=A0A4S3TLU2_9EURY|nr:flagella cluster protein [Salinadaptatus halalkaliphilus]THE63598.1 flagella cluster protein [Salinadaptatus halalkaliphilus]